MSGFLLALGLALFALLAFAWRQGTAQPRPGQRRAGYCPLCATPVPRDGAWTCLGCGYRSELDDHPEARSLLSDTLEVTEALHQLSEAADAFAQQGDVTTVGTTTVTALRRVGVIAARHPELIGKIDLSLPRDRVDLIHRVETVEHVRQNLARALLSVGPHL